MPLLARPLALIACVLMATPALAFPSGLPVLAPPSMLTDPPLGIAPTLDVDALLLPAHRFVPRDPGVARSMTIVYGPHLLPAGWDFNRVALDLPPLEGFLTKLRYRLVDAVTQEEPDNMGVHIHHALFFDGGLDFDRLLFGTGEERTALDLDARSDAVPGGPRYGVFLSQGQAVGQLLMLHNKEQKHRVVNILVDATFVFGTRDEILQAQDCGALPLLPGEACLAGRDFHDLVGQLWGRTFDVPRNAAGDDNYRFPSGNPAANVYAADADGTLIHAAGHLHPNGKVDVIANLGPSGSGCEADLDGDGFPGTTLLVSDKIDRLSEAWPRSEDFQMGVTQAAWRAPVREGDRIAQFGVYSNREHASYAAMAFAATHVDPLQPPPARVGPCTAANMGPYLVADSSVPVTRSVPNRPWDHHALPVCGVPGWPGCERAVGNAGPGLDADTVAIGGFQFVPGGLGLVGPLGQPPRVPEGGSLTFVNGDVSTNVRHTVTSCPWPCNGPYVGNYPLPDGRFDSRPFANLDIFDGGSVPPNEGDDPQWSTPANLAPGLYSYYCRMHPWMRGAFEVVDA